MVCILTMYVCILVLSIVTHPQDQAADVGASVNFTCNASITSMISYRWTFNGSNVLDEIGHVEGAISRNLRLTGVNVTEGGQYNCIASSSGVSVTSNPALLYSKMSIVMMQLQLLNMHAYVILHMLYSM